MTACGAYQAWDEYTWAGGLGQRARASSCEDRGMVITLMCVDKMESVIRGQILNENAFHFAQIYMGREWIFLFLTYLLVNFLFVR